MSNTILGCSPELDEEVEKGLVGLGKYGYTAHVSVLASGGLSIMFTLGESKQLMEFTKDEWRTGGMISKTIIEKLDI
jgi:hypothetical protein